MEAKERERKRKAAADKLLRKEEQNKLNTKNSLKNAKTLPAQTLSDGTFEPQGWYHIGMGQHERIKYIESMFKRFENILRQQKAARKNPDLEWVEFPAELIDSLVAYESDPSDALINLRISDAYRLKDSGRTLEEEKARLQIPTKVLKKIHLERLPVVVPYM